MNCFQNDRRKAFRKTVLHFGFDIIWLTTGDAFIGCLHLKGGRKNNQNKTEKEK